MVYSQTIYFNAVAHVGLLQWCMHAWFSMHAETDKLFKLNIIEAQHAYMESLYIYTIVHALLWTRRYNI